MINSFHLTSFLKKKGSVSIHMRNIQILATQMSKLVSNLPSPIMNRLSKLNSDGHYHLRQISQFSRHLIRPVYHVAEGFPYLGPKTWDIPLDDYKTIENLDTFKIKIEK